jgi:hypothetical protein
LEMESLKLFAWPDLEPWSSESQPPKVARIVGMSQGWPASLVIVLKDANILFPDELAPCLWFLGRQQVSCKCLFTRRPRTFKKMTFEKVLLVFHSFVSGFSYPSLYTMLSMTDITALTLQAKR